MEVRAGPGRPRLCSDNATLEMEALRAAGQMANGRSLPVNGAQERTRTSTPFRAPPPEDGASTNSATWARGRARPLEGAACAVNWDERPVGMRPPTLHGTRSLLTVAPPPWQAPPRTIRRTA